METKVFFDVFNTLVVDDDQRIMFSEVNVKKVSVNHSKTLLRIYILSDHLIEKKDILKMERLIEKQLMRGKNVEVKIIEEFCLPDSYNARTLYDTYNESILLELKETYPILYPIYKKAKVEFADEESMKITMADTTVARDSSCELSKILERIFDERCGLFVNFTLDYEKSEENPRARESDIMIEREVAMIAYRAGYATDTTEKIDAAVGEADANASKTGDGESLSAQEAKTAENKEHQGRKNDNALSSKSSDQGKDFKKPLR